MRNAIIYSDKMKEYDLGHVLRGDRFQRFLSLFEDTLGGNPAFEVVEPPYSTHEELKMIHTEEYIERVERYESRDPHDTPLSAPLVRAAKLLAGAGRLAGELVQSGGFSTAVVIGGGVQHATREHERGFGIFSDVGICAQHLKNKYGLRRIMILDTDAHAGDGIYYIFASDPTVLFISIHQDQRTLYPGPGYANSVGVGEGEGYSVNVPLIPGTADLAYQYVLDQLIAPIAEEFEPQLILFIAGSDTHFMDGITRMGLTLKGIRMIADRVRAIANRLCEDKVVAFAGSGYDPDGIVFHQGWLATVCGLAQVEASLEEPYPFPFAYRSDYALPETRALVESLRSDLSVYWKNLS